MRLWKPTILIFLNNVIFIDCRGIHLHLCDLATDISWHSAWSELGRYSGLPMPDKCGAKTNSRKEMVYGTTGHYPIGWSVAIWFHLHRDVFHLYVVLGLQDLLCLWLYAPGLCHLGHCHRLRYHCLHLFLTKCRRL